MLAEPRSLKRHETRKLVPRKTAKNVKAITCRWVFAVKRDEQGRVNYNETYAPVICFEATRAAIYFVVQRGWVVLQYDVGTAVLSGDLEELIFMEQPPGFQVDGHNYICLLLKSLYALKQAPNIWNKTLHTKLMTMGFARIDSDYGPYVLMENGEIKLLLTVYVDDLLLMCPRAKYAKIAALLQETFELTTMGTIKYLLDVES
ncbi:Integrase, catalytic core protein [Phytophthora megakarya]|uniref:Integrase, catalytic core protein n=1 Tax=Phytophthora megakarya TaxID=4795 RepID=A0A225WJL9_9STRA|nr:Integrase, catalytic core protein [Phytophthora megakarya]